MKERQRVHKKRVILTQERWKVFHDYFSLSLKNYLRFGQVDLRKQLISVKKLFSLSDHGGKIEVPITSGEFESLKIIGRSNSEVRKAIANINKVGKRQTFRNLMILDNIYKQLTYYKRDLFYSRIIRKLCRAPYLVGMKTAAWKKRRLSEVDEFIKNIMEAIKYCQSGIFLKEIESYIEAYIDFFEKTILRFEEMNKDIRESLNQYSDIVDTSIVVDKEKQCSLKLPSWDLLRDLDE